MLLANIPNIIAPGTVMHATIHSAAIPIPNTYGYAVQVGWTGTVNGTFELEVSCDPFVAGPTAAQLPVNWSIMPDSEQLTGGITTPFTWNFTGLAGYNWVRLTYLDASGGSATGSITF